MDRIIKLEQGSKIENKPHLKHNIEAKPELGIYIHIPFCIQKCLYCDFISFPNKLELQEKYVNKVMEEVEHEKELFKKYHVTTIYIGGGTPSAIESKYIKRVLEKIKENINIDEHVVEDVNGEEYESNTENEAEETDEFEKIEVTIEVNPGTVTRQKLLEYKQVGVNRLSIGLQSTKGQLLKEIGRIHTYEDFAHTYELATEIGFQNINIDLMIGLPNQTIQDIKDSLQKIIHIGTQKPQHISVYSLIVESGTPMEKLIEKGILELPTDEEERKQYQYVKNMLELEGYKHYEISNFALYGKESKHNTNCWKQKEYIGFGVAAHSYIERKRFSNTADLGEYLESDWKKIKTVHEVQTQEEQEKEYMLLGLRQLEGVEVLKFKAKFGKNPIFVFREEIEKLVNEGLLEVDLDVIRLTRKGLDLANLVWEEFV